MAIFLVEKISLKKDERGLERFKEVYIVPKLNKFVEARNEEEAMDKCGVVALPMGFPRGCAVLYEALLKAQRLYINLDEWYPTVLKFTKLKEQTGPLSW